MWVHRRFGAAAPRPYSATRNVSGNFKSQTHLFSHSILRYQLAWWRYGGTETRSDAYSSTRIFYWTVSANRGYTLPTNLESNEWRAVISWSLSPRHGASSGCGWRNGLQYGKWAANILNKQWRIADKRWSSSSGVGRGASNCSP